MDAVLSYARDFTTSAGFGGVAALVAAVIAYRAARTGVRQAEAEADQARLHARREQWWSRARWALDCVLSDDARTRTIGYNMLEALGESQYADEHEFEIIDTAVEAALGPLRKRGTQKRRLRARQAPV